MQHEKPHERLRAGLPFAVYRKMSHSFVPKYVFNVNNTGILTRDVMVDLVFCQLDVFYIDSIIYPSIHRIITYINVKILSLKKH